MTPRRKDIIEKALSERDRQFNLPGAEWDGRNTPNDWLAIAASYVLRNSTRNRQQPSVEDFEDDLIKAIAVLMAALENMPGMKSAGHLRD